jgi:hypothetical protein
MVAAKRKIHDTRQDWQSGSVGPFPLRIKVRVKETITLR